MESCCREWGRKSLAIMVAEDERGRTTRSHSRRTDGTVTRNRVERSKAKDEHTGVAWRGVVNYFLNFCDDVRTVRRVRRRATAVTHASNVNSKIRAKRRYDHRLKLVSKKYQ